MILVRVNAVFSKYYTEGWIKLLGNKWELLMLIYSWEKHVKMSLTLPVESRHAVQLKVKWQQHTISSAPLFISHVWRLKKAWMRGAQRCGCRIGSMHRRGRKTGYCTNWHGASSPSRPGWPGSPFSPLKPRKPCVIETELGVLLG